MLRVGLTGGIGSGKSAAAKMFENLGVPIVDADIVAREVVEPGESALQRIAEHFGASILLADGNLDRRQLRERIFSDPDEKTWLESLLHPLIRQRIEEQLRQQDAPYALLVSPLLLETDQQFLVDKILIIDCNPGQQIARVVERDGTSAEQTRAIMDSQMDAASRRQRADLIIENDSGLDALQSQVQAMHEELLRLAMTGPK